MDLGKIGVWSGFGTLGAANAAEAARTAEDLGYGAFWLGGSPTLPEVRPLLEGSTDLVVATGIVNVWSYEAPQLTADYADLASGFGERLLVGIGIGHPEATSDYRRPLTTMREYLDALDAADAPVPVDRRCLAALGPKMLDLSGERSLGTHPYFTPPEHTRAARERLGDGKLVAPEIAVVVDTDRDRARATARQFASVYLQLRNYTNNLLDFGFTEADIADGGSDRLIDVIVPQGSAEALAEHVQAHLDAGADHVCVQTLGVQGVPRDAWGALARVLIG